MASRKLSFLGDVVLDRAYMVNVGLDDFVFNLEHPLSCDGIPARDKVNFCADRSYIEETFGKMPVAVNLANNHIADFGDEAYLKTIEFLKENHIAYFGSGNESDNFNNPAIIQFDGKRMALLGYSCPSTNAIFGNSEHYGSAKLDPDRIIKDIELSKKSVDQVVVNLHWGAEDIRYPKPDDVKLARKFIDSGADLIVGHHAHVIQSFEVYKGKYIFYGLGHFIFPYKERPSYFDGNEFLKVYKPVARKANREGLIITLDAKDNVGYETIYFDNYLVDKKKARIPKWVPNNNRQYKLYQNFILKLRLMRLFLRNPKLLTISRIKRFISS